MQQMLIQTPTQIYYCNICQYVCPYNSKFTKKQAKLIVCIVLVNSLIIMKGFKIYKINYVIESSTCMIKW